MKHFELLMTFLLVLLVSGCDTGPGQPQTPGNDNATGEVAAPETSEQATEQAAEKNIESEMPNVQESTTTKEPAPKTEVREVQSGDDKRGHYEKHEFLAAPVGVYFRAAEGMELERITAAMNLYKALNDNKPPATEEIFMKEVIEANRIKLPQLRDGWKYLYEPSTGKLMVEKPVE